MKRIGVVQLTAGDDELFRLLLMLGVMTVDQIQRVRYYQPESGRLSVRGNVNKRLTRLRQAGYLECEDVYTEERSRTLVYRLGEAALPELRLRNPRLTQTRLYHPAERNAQQMLHALMVTECAVRVIESLRGSDVTTPDIDPLALPFYHSRLVADPSRRRSLERFATHHEVLVDGKRDMIRPDLVFALARGSRARLFFLEADRGFEGYVELARKVRCYHAHARQGSSAWQSGGAIQDLRVLLVTTSQQRVDGLLDHLAQTPGVELLRCATFANVVAENVLFAVPWHFVQSDRRRLHDTLMRSRAQTAPDSGVRDA